ncbi:peroxiredoxin family protein [Planococcus sp. YIM B11945]|uniref:peroxiredoxin family protein n=1 Tax=Planococcus sp. YIM B11945 TaxID=3435410 RepID=UPI003D7D5756
MSGFALGQETPDFSLPATTGETFTFNDHKSKQAGWHLIVFFRGSWCSACIKTLKDLEENKAYFKGENIHVITISTDFLDDLTAMAEEHQFSFPVLADENLEALKAYEVYFHGDGAPFEDTGTHGEPAYFLVNDKGELLYQQRQTNPYGRPTAAEIQQIVAFIRKKLDRSKIGA